MSGNTSQFFLVFFVCIALGISLFIGIYALFRSQSNKKNYFLLMQTMIIVYLAGYLLEITSNNIDEAFLALKIMYIGGYFMTPFAFFFAADYCNLKIHPIYIRTPLLILSMATVLVMMTTKYRHLVYIDYDLDRTVSHHLTFTPGPLYPVMHIAPAICMFLTLAVVLYQIKKWKQKYRKQLIVFCLCLLIPFATQAIYFLSIITGINVHKVNFLPHSLGIMSFCLYLTVMRSNMFEIISTATASAMEHIKEGFVLVDEDNNYLSSNPAAAKMFPEITKLTKGDSIFFAKSGLEELKDVKNDSIEFSTEGENARHFRASVSPVFSKNQTLRAKVIIFSEITDSVILVEKLKNAAYIDALTGIYNRKHFYELANMNIERAIRLNQSIYTAILDLDFFKNINDTYGHAAGDKVLKKAANIVRQTIRSYDLIGRYGGEEFVLLITDLDETMAYNQMERIRENMEHGVTDHEGIEIKITCSIGLAKFEKNDTLDSSVNKADKAMYAAKSAGRNLVRVFAH